jgi:hypothetical protein
MKSFTEALRGFLMKGWSVILIAAYRRGNGKVVSAKVGEDARGNLNPLRERDNMQPMRVK